MAFEILNPHGKANIILISEHASNHIPDDYKKLGLDDSLLETHIAWDIGIGSITRNLSAMLDAPAVLACFSRLLIDANRGLDQVGLIPETSDGHSIPGNQSLSTDELNERIEKFYNPFHQSVDQLIKSNIKDTHAPIILNMHSFTPMMNNKQRKWHAGMLWNKDDRVAKALGPSLTKRGFIVGDNEPYSGQQLNHTMNTHGTQHGYPHLNIEIRQDEISNEQDINKWSDVLFEEINTIRNLPEMSYIKHY